MRILISILMLAQLTGCIPDPFGNDYADKGTYAPHPRVEMSTFWAKDRMVTAAYVRHSQGDVLFQLSLHPASVPETAKVVALHRPEPIPFTATRYENFERSFDMFKDGSVVLVPLGEGAGEGAGVFVNLLSGKRYFLAPAVKSRHGLAQVRNVNIGSQFIVIVPDDKRAHQRVTEYPEFRK